MNNTTDSFNATTLNYSYFEFHARFGWTRLWITVIVLGLLILCTIIGNVFVVAAILLEKHLQGVSNYLIASLAVADLMVATLPMPVAAIYEVSEDWWLGEALCDFWVCSDVLCCTASILHLVGIALDRYWAVTNAEYIRRRTGRRIGIMIGIFWFLSVLISIPARFHTTRSYNYGGYSPDMVLDEPPSCRINQEHGYTVFSNIGAFYMPMIFIIGIYARIYQVARARIRRSAFKQSATSSLSMTQKKQREKHHQKLFKRSLCSSSCCRYNKYDEKRSIKLAYVKNNPQAIQNNMNQENPSSSHIADTDCTEVARHTSNITEISAVKQPTATTTPLTTTTSSDNKYCSFMNQLNNDKSIPYVDDVENKSNYCHSIEHLNGNYIHTKPVLLNDDSVRQNLINCECKPNIYTERSVNKQRRKSNHQKEMKKSNSLLKLDYRANSSSDSNKFDTPIYSSISRNTSSAPPILINMTNSSTYFSELTNSNSQLSETPTTDHTNSVMWSSSSSTGSGSASSSCPSLPSLSSSSFSRYSSLPVDSQYHYHQRHHHHQHHHHHRDYHHHEGLHNHHHHHQHHHHHHHHQGHHHGHIHKRRYCEGKMSKKQQNRYLGKLKTLCNCCPSVFDSKSNHNHLSDKGKVSSENPKVGQLKYSAFCCFKSHLNSSVKDISLTNDHGTCYSVVDPSSVSQFAQRKNNISAVNTDINNNNSASKKTENHILLDVTKRQNDVHGKMCHLLRLENSHRKLAKSVSNLIANRNADSSTTNPVKLPQHLHQQPALILTPVTSALPPSQPPLPPIPSNTLNDETTTTITSNLMSLQQTQVNRERLETKRERKAISTLAIITGCFLLCWLPFFIVALISPFTENFTISKFGQSTILWLGYSNSLLNPIIYTIFSPDFRNAFRKILFGRYNLRSLSR
ncbi:unnamed protein product [Trichobilharzia szidati]|nr:unnamed protein product [Trichobilharzia szidati]